MYFGASTFVDKMFCLGKLSGTVTTCSGVILSIGVVTSLFSPSHTHMHAHTYACKHSHMHAHTHTRITFLLL